MAKAPDKAALAAGQAAAQTPPALTPAPKPDTVYETDCMTGMEIDKQNKAYASMGLGIVVISIDKYVAKRERQSDGTYKRTTIRRRRNADAAAPGDG